MLIYNNICAYILLYINYIVDTEIYTYITLHTLLITMYTYLSDLRNSY